MEFENNINSTLLGVLRYLALPVYLQISAQYSDHTDCFVDCGPGPCLAVSSLRVTRRTRNLHYTAIVQLDPMNLMILHYTAIAQLDLMNLMNLHYTVICQLDQNESDELALNRNLSVGSDEFEQKDFGRKSKKYLFIDSKAKK